MPHKAPVSVCIISANDPHLEACLASFADYVEEICIVINDKKDFTTKSIARKYGAKTKIFTTCNDSKGRIEDFSAARNESLKMATQPYVMWIDSDDLLVGADKLAKVCSEMPQDSLMLFPYEYSYNQQGQILCKHYRERLAPRGKVSFLNAVHEVMVPTSSLTSIISEELSWCHQRHKITKPIEPGRNLRILQKEVKKNPDNIRNMYYIGLEYSNVGDTINAISYLTKYVEKSGWDDERLMACQKLIEIYEVRKDYKNSLIWSWKALEIKTWFESYYALCRSYYYLENWQRSAHFGKIALDQPPTETVLFVNESDRFNIHQFYNVALNNVGKLEEAYKSCLLGLQGNPNEYNLLNNKRLYEDFLKIGAAKEGKLKIVFITGPSLESWDPETIKKTGIGGSETMLVQMARNLSQLGHSVSVYASPPNPGSYFDGVRYEDLHTFKNVSCDVLVVSRYAPFLDDSYGTECKIKLLWLHDTVAIAATADLLLQADKILCLSEWHRDNVIKAHNLYPDQVLTTRNAIEYIRFDKKVKRIKHRCINTSSPDRSYPSLLQMWPRIRKAVPDAELLLCYGMDNWRKSAQHDKCQMDVIEKLEEQLEDMAALGVKFVGRVDQDKLAELFLSSKAHLFPTWWSETSCISMMESQAAGCHIIASNLAAIPETCAGYDKAVLIDGNWLSKEYQDKFVAETIKALRTK